MPEEQRGSTPTPPADDHTARALESFELRDAMIAGLASGANDLTGAALSLTEAARLTRWEKRIAISLLAINTIVMFGVGLLSIAVVQIASQNREGLTASEARLERALNRVLETQIAVEECSLIQPVPDNEEDFELCVADRMDRLPK